MPLLTDNLHSVQNSCTPKLNILVPTERNDQKFAIGLCRKCFVCTILLFATLRKMQLVVDSVVCYELGVSTLFCHGAVVNDDDFVSVLNSWQTMSDNEACTTNLRLIKCLLHHLHSHTHKKPAWTYIHPFNGPLSGTTRVSRYQKGKTIWILLKQEAVSGSGISWAICKSAPRSRQITTPAPHQSVFLHAGCPSCHPTNSVKAPKACPDI